MIMVCVGHIVWHAAVFGVDIQCSHFFLPPDLLFLSFLTSLHKNTLLPQLGWVLDPSNHL